LAKKKKRSRKLPAKAAAVHVAQEVTVSVNGAADSGNDADKALSRLTRPMKVR
jgi:hypothetical protein